MQIFGYPGERVDFVSTSGAAGSVYFGDSEDQVEEFFGPAHTKSAELITYFSGSISLALADGRVTDIIVTPSKSRRERVDVYLGKEKLSGRTADELDELTAVSGVAVTVTDEGVIESVTFA